MRLHCLLASEPQLPCTQNEEKRTRDFLSNMLPEVVLHELRSGGTSLIAHERRDASVLFTDIVSFTTLASRLSPEVRSLSRSIDASDVSRAP